jgi:hypothetical protein
LFSCVFQSGSTHKRWLEPFQRLSLKESALEMAFISNSQTDCVHVVHRHPSRHLHQRGSLRDASCHRASRSTKNQSTKLSRNAWTKHALAANLRVVNALLWAYSPVTVPPFHHQNQLSRAERTYRLEAEESRLHQVVGRRTILGSGVEQLGRISALR